MKRAKNNSTSENHSEAFQQGIKQIVRNKTTCVDTYPDYELNAILRYEQETASQAPKAQPSFGFYIVDLLQELVWQNRDHQQQH